jgi:hypothetical protein
MRGKTLGELVTQLRAELGQAPNSSVGESETPSLKHLLARTQEILYDEHDWPHLSGQWFDVTLAAGQRYYDFPTQFNFERAHHAFYEWGGDWIPLCAGFDALAYNVYDSDEDARSDPPQAWRLYTATQFEVWPMPATSGGKIRWVGTKKLSALVANSDAADLDDRMIVLFAAAEKLSDKPRGRALQTLASRRLAQMKSRTNKTTEPFRIGEGGRSAPRPKELVVRVAGA